MEIAGREIDPKMLAIGGVGVAGVMLLMRRGNSGANEPQTVNLVPSGELGWETIQNGDPSGRLIGGPGPAGEPGPAGAPGLPGAPGAPGTSAPPPTDVDQDTTTGGRRRRPGRRDRKDDKGDPNRRRDQEPGGGGRNERNRDRGNGQIGNPDRPRQPNRSDPPKVDDPRLDDPKRSRRRAEGRGGLRDDRRNDDVSGDIDIDVSGGKERARGRRARANADGGRANVGNVGQGTTGKIDASGGKASANASGGNGNRTGQAAKQAAKKVLNKGKRKGGDAFAGDDPDYENGHGRRDGRSGAAAGEVNTNPTPGSSVGGFFGLPSPLRSTQDVVVVKEGDTLSGLARRYYGNANMYQRFYTLNHDVLVGTDGVLRAGTRLKV